VFDVVSKYDAWVLLEGGCMLDATMITKVSQVLKYNRRILITISLNSVNNYENLKKAIYFPICLH
jgi:hypothetical protein